MSLDVRPELLLLSLGKARRADMDVLPAFFNLKFENLFAFQISRNNNVIFIFIKKKSTNFLRNIEQTR